MRSTSSIQSGEGGGGRRLVALTVMIVVAVISLFSFRQTLDYFFVDADTLSLIDTARIEEPGDITRVLTSDLFEATRQDYVFSGDDRVWPNFDLAWFYRPVDILSLSFDHALWGLDPMGYHLSNLLLHILVAWLVFLIARKLTGNQLSATVATAILIIHPLLFETLPASARRFETLFTLFFLASFLLLIRNLESRSAPRLMLALSLLCYLLALGSKETALIAPPILFAYLWFIHFSDVEDKRSRAIAAIRPLVPFLALTVVFFIWRTYVLGGTGGYTSYLSGPVDFLVRSGETIQHFFVSLLYPGGFTGQADDPVADVFITFGARAALAIIIALIVLRGSRQVEDEAGLASWRRLTGIVLVSVIVLALAGLVSHRAAGYIADLVNGAFGRDMASVGWIRSGCLAVLFVSGILLALTRWRQLVAALPRSQASGLVPFLLAWLLMPLPLFLATKIFFNRYMYFSLAPFAIALAALGVPAAGAAWRRIREDYNRRGRHKWDLVRHVLDVSLAIVVIVCFSFMPSITPLNESELWRDNSTFSEEFFNRLAPLVEDSSSDAAVLVMHFPRGFIIDRRAVMAQQVFLPRDYSVKSWLNLRYPGNEIIFSLQNENIWFREADSRFEFKVSNPKGKNLVIEMQYPDLPPIANGG